jgi:hypothetical protein
MLTRNDEILRVTKVSDWSYHETILCCLEGRVSIFTSYLSIKNFFIIGINNIVAFKQLTLNCDTSTKVWSFEIRNHEGDLVSVVDKNNSLLFTIQSSPEDLSKPPFPEDVFGIFSITASGTNSLAVCYHDELIT